MIKHELLRDLILFLEDISLKIIRLILVVIVIALSSYALLTDISKTLIPYVVFFLGLMILVTGIMELRQKKKATAITLFFVTGFNFYVLLKILLN